jgi:hypothetical protein
MSKHSVLGSLFTFVFVLTAPSYSADNAAVLKLDIGELASQAKEVVNISINKNTINWASQAIQSQGGDANELREVMKDLDNISVQTLEFDEEHAPIWQKLADLTQGVLKRLDGPGWTPIVSVTERKKDGGAEIVRISLFNDASGEPGGLAVFVLERKEVVLINIAGKVKLDQLARIGRALGEPDMFDELIPAVSPSKKTTGHKDKPEKDKN